MERLEPGLRLLRAPNPSPMTAEGTNTWLVGDGDVVVIDPGPAIPAHLAAILGALQPGERISHILVTHSHLDHSPLARPLAAATGAPVLAAGPSDWGLSRVMAALNAAGGLGGGEGVDAEFAPDERIGDGDSVADLRVIATPGHMANHLSFAWNGAVFSGDLVMGWSTSLVSPPDGDMTAFMASVAMLGARNDRVFYPGHGAPVTEPAARCAALLAHRRAREGQIIAALSHRPATAAALAAQIYTATAPALQPAAARNVLAHLIDLNTRRIAAPIGPLTATARFTLT